MLKAIESGATIDAEFFKAQQVQKGSKTIKERLLKRLAGGCICTLIGIVLTVIGFISRNMMSEIQMSTDAFIVPRVGGIIFAIGVGLLIVFFVGKKMLARKMEAEVKEMEQK